MQIYTFPLKDQIFHANELMRESGQTTSDTRKIREAFQIYQSAVDNAEYANIPDAMRLALFLHLNDLIKHLPDSKDAVLKTITKQLMSEIRHFEETKSSDDIAERVLAVIYHEPDKKYVVSLYEQYDALSSHARLRVATTQAVIKQRLSYLNDLYFGKGEKPDPIPFYQTIFSWREFLVKDILEKKRQILSS